MRVLPLLATQGYCVKCKAKREMKGEKQITMKKVFGIAVVALLGLSTPSFAQSKTDKAAHAIHIDLFLLFNK